jgi:hypothetical protein
VKTTDNLDLKGMLFSLSRLAQEDYCQYVFSQDRFGQLVSPDEKKRLMNLAITCGISIAKKTVERYNADVFDLIEENGLKIRRVKNLVVMEKDLCGWYKDRVITIAESVVSAARYTIDRFDLADLVECQNIEEIILCHELYHYYESILPLFTSTYKLILWKIGPIKNRASLACLSETAAMAFAKKITGVSYSPYMLNILFCWNNSKAGARRLYRRIQEKCCQT